MQHQRRFVSNFHMMMKAPDETSAFRVHCSLVKGARQADGCLNPPLQAAIVEDPHTQDK